MGTNKPTKPRLTGALSGMNRSPMTRTRREAILNHSRRQLNIKARGDGERGDGRAGVKLWTGRPPGGHVMPSPEQSQASQDGWSHSITRANRMAATGQGSVALLQSSLAYGPCMPTSASRPTEVRACSKGQDTEAARVRNAIAPSRPSQSSNPVPRFMLWL